MPNSTLAIFLSDIHLSHKAPSGRALEGTWYEEMAKVLAEVQEVIDHHGKPPVVCAGDVFDRWNSPPELINFAIKHLPRMYAVPGQHDLPFHQYSDIKRSAYWTLVEAGKIVDLKAWESVPVSFSTGPRMLAFVLHGFPFGFLPEPAEDREIGRYGEAAHIAVAHRYIWTAKCKYEGAPNDRQASAYFKMLEGYDLSVFGDNHIDFKTGGPSGDIVNCGSLMRRKRSERKGKPCVWILKADAPKMPCRLEVRPHYLTSGEEAEFIEDDLPEVEDTPLEMREFLEELYSLEKDSWDFAEAVNRALRARKVSDRTHQAVLRAVEGRG